MASRPPFPPFTLEIATEKVRLAEDARNTREPGAHSFGNAGGAAGSDGGVGVMLGAGQAGRVLVLRRQASQRLA
jgi:hypothetical protein